jgi:hypothetical protein
LSVEVKSLVARRFSTSVGIVGGGSGVSGNACQSSTFSDLSRKSSSLGDIQKVTPRLKSTKKVKKLKKSWTSQQKRAFHRIMSLLQYWFSNGYQVLWFDLTSSPISSAEEMNKHYTVLKKRMERQFGYANTEHLLIKTTEGYGVYHGFIAYKTQSGEKGNSFYIPQAWISDNWNEIHGATNVWIGRVRKGNKSQRKVSCYSVSQYCANQPGFVYLSWSWKRGLGGALVRTWKELRDFISDRNRVIGIWNRVLAGEEITLRQAGSAFTHANFIEVFHPPPHLSYDFSVHFLP